MDLTQLANLGEFIGGIGSVVGGLAVLVTLIYLALQVRQGNRQGATNHHELTLAALRSTRHAVAADVSLAELLLRGHAAPNDLSGADWMRFEEFVTSQLEIWEMAFVNRERGTIDQVIWDGWDAFGREKYATPGHREVWQRTRLQFHAPFRDYIEEEVFSS